MTDLYMTSPSDKEAIKKALCAETVRCARNSKDSLCTVAYNLIGAFAVVDECVLAPGCLHELDAQAIKAALCDWAQQDPDKSGARVWALSISARNLIAACSFVHAFTRSDSSEALSEWFDPAASARSPETHQVMSEAVAREGRQFVQRVADAACARAEALRAAALSCAVLEGRIPVLPPADVAASVGEPAALPPVLGVSL